MTRVFITGPTGCVGARLVKWLFENGADEVIGFSRSSDTSRLDASVKDRLELVAGDISDASEVEQIITGVDPTHLIHLAAAQTPFCNAHPLAGMRINLDGTRNVIKAAAQLQHLQRFVFASSAAVYGSRAIYPGPTVKPEDELRPVNHYGHWKLSGEAMLRAFAEETGIASVAWRFASTIGPGRDQGLTSAPTTAMKAVALGLPFRLPYTGRECYHYVDDVAAAFGIGALHAFSGHAAFNIRGTTVDDGVFLETLTRVSDELGLSDPFDIAVAEGAEPNTFVCDLDEASALAAFPALPLTNLDDAVRYSLEFFKLAADSGELRSDQVTT